FSVGRQRDLLLAVPYRYRLEARSGVTEVSCERSGRRTVAIPPPSELKVAVSTLSDIVQRQGMRTLLLIVPRNDEFRFYLYNPNSAPREIPLKAPLRVAEVLEAPAESSLPLASDAVAGIAERPGALGVESGPATVDAAELRLSRSAEAPRWYNSP